MLSFATLVALFDTATNSSVKDEHTIEELELVAVNGDISEVKSKFIIEPLIMISSDLKFDETYDKQIELQMNLFSSYVAQVFQILVSVYHLDPAVAIDILNPKYSVSKGLARGADKLMRQGKKLEDLPDYIVSARDEELKTQAKVSNYTAATMSKMDVKDDELASKLKPAVERHINITLTAKDAKGNTSTIVIPITIKPTILLVNREDLVNVIDTDGDQATILERYHAARAGEISWFNLFVPLDMVDKYHNNKLKDRKGILKYLKERTVNSLATLGTRNIRGLNLYYGMTILSKDILDSLKAPIKGDPLTNNKIKEKLLGKLMTLGITVYDPTAEMFMLMMKGTKGTSLFTRKQLVKSEKNDIEELLKALNLNKTPKF